MPTLTAAATVRVLSALWRHFMGGGDPECPSDTWEGPSKVLTTCRPAAGSPCALGQVTSIFGPQFTICQKTWQKCADWVSAVSLALGQVLLQPEPQFPYLGHEVI